MKVVSKFSIAYIVIGIFCLVVPLLVAFMICFATRTNFDYEDNFAFDQQSIIKFLIVSIVIVALVFYKFGRFKRITVTEDYVCLNHLITRTIKYIKYDEIEEIIRYKEAEAGGTFTGNYMTVSILFNIIMKNGKIIKFDDFPYDDFEKVENFIFENFKKVTNKEPQKFFN